MATRLLVATGIIIGMVGASHASSRYPEVNDLQLHDGFTLKYATVRVMPRTPEQIQGSIAAVRAQTNMWVQRGLATHQEADARFKQMASDLSARIKLASPERMMITFSALDHKLLYGFDTESARQVAIYDGQKTYVAQNGGEALNVYNGFNLSQVGNFVVPGAGLPYLPLLEPGGAATPDRNGGWIEPEKVWAPSLGPSIERMPGVISFSLSDGKLQVHKVTITTPHGVWMTWEYSALHLIQGHWIPSKITCIEYDLVSGPQNKTNPWINSICDYRLIDSDEQPMPSQDFDVNTYLKPHDTMVTSFVNPGHSVSFVYNGKDSIDSQTTFWRDYNKQRIKAVDNGKLALHAWSGVWVLLALVSGGAGWLLWKRRGEQMR